MSQTDKAKELDEYLAAYECTCSVGDTTSDDDHSPTCNLWDCWEFTEGWAAWDAEAKCLVDVFEAGKANVIDEGNDMGAALPGFAKGVKVAKAKAKTVVTKGGALTGGIVSTTSTWAKCRHYQAPVPMPDGTIIYASSATYDRKGAPIPVLGIYLDGCWKPDTIAFHVGCPDYGVPIPNAAQVLHIAREGIRLAREGHRVEVGCIGGHGRTGMMLAVMATVIDPDIADAVRYIQDTYCKHAIESPVQEWYVAGIKCELAGTEWPEKPVMTYSSGGASTVKWKYQTKDDMPEEWDAAEQTKHWSDHADDCPCYSCVSKRPKPLCSVCDGELFSKPAMDNGKHTYDCSKSYNVTRTSKTTATGNSSTGPSNTLSHAQKCPTCNALQWAVVGMGACTDVFHCASFQPKRCKCFRHHPESLMGCECERCK